MIMRARQTIVTTLVLLSLLPAFPAQAQDSALAQKIRQLIITFPTYAVIDGKVAFPADTNPTYGGFLINGWSQQDINLVTDKDAACALKKTYPESLIFIDQEGGVTRRYKDLDTIGANKAVQISPEEYKQAIHKMSLTLKERCIDVNLAPVLNISRTTPAPYSHPRKIDEKRSYSADPAIVKTYASAFAAASYEAGIIPTTKHFPGDILIDEVAMESPYINKRKGFRWEVNEIDTDYPLQKNIDMFFFGKPQFIMWSSNIFTRFSDKPAFMVDEFRTWINDKNCDCLLISDALGEVSNTDEVILSVFHNSDMVMMYEPPDQYIQKIIDFVEQGKITEESIDNKIKKLEKFKKRAGLS